MLQERKSELQGRLETLRRQRGVAVLGGASARELTDEIATVERDIEALGNAETEVVAREREAAIKAADEQLARLRADLAASETVRLDAITAAEAAIRKAAAALGAAFGACRESEKIMGRLGGRLPISLSAHAHEGRIINRTIAILNTIENRCGANSLGSLRFSSIGFASAKDDWRQLEQREGERALASFLKGES